MSRASKATYHQQGDADNFQTVEQALDSVFDLIAALTPPSTSAVDSEFNIIAYGAVGDDATDNTVAIQAALDAAKANGGGVVIIPKGTFRTGPVSYDTSATSDQLAPRITIRGTNKSSSILKMKTGATGNLLSITGNSGAYQQANFILKDFRLYGQLQSNESGLGITSCVYGAVENVYVSNMGLYGANIFDTDQMHFMGCEFTACVAGMTIGNGTPTTTSPNSLVFVDCHWTNNSQWGMDAYGLNAVTFIGGSIQYNGQLLGDTSYYGCKITNNNGAGYGTVNFTGTIFEGNRGKADLWINYAAGAANFITVNLNGCAWYRTVIAATNYASTNGILLDGASTALRCNMSGNIFFDGGGYTDNAGRPWISNTNASSKIYATGDYFKPCTATGTTLEHPAWSGMTHIPSSSGLSFDWGDVTLTHSANLLTLAGGSLTATYNGSLSVPTIKAINANNNANLETGRFMAHRGTGAASDRGYLGLTMDNASGSEVFAAKIGSYWQSCAAGTEEGGMFIRLPLAGTERDNYFFGAGNFTCGSNGQVALGSGTVNWSTAYLAAGAAVNWNNGNYTLTHSAGLLTANGALSLGTSNALTCGTIELGAASDTTLARVSAGVVSIEGSNILTAATGQPLNAAIEGAWTAYTPTPTPGAGAFTTVTAAGRYRLVGKTCEFTCTITYTNIGTGSGKTVLPLPSGTAKSNTAFYGIETTATGKIISGYAAAAASGINLQYYDNTNIMVNTATATVSGVYELA